MKTVTAILIIFCAYLRAADSIEIKAINVKDAVSDIEETVSDVAHEVIPDCVFGVQSVSMLLYTRNFPYGKNISVNEMCRNFDPSQPIYFMVHGFVADANVTYSYKLSKELIEKDATVFSLDWSDAACTTGLPLVKFAAYPSAVKNTREIGRLMARYVISLIENCGIPSNNITFIGHSLGAHICGFASKHMKESNYDVVPLLFGVDPAQPLFMLNKCDDRLCDTDADTVIALHTSSLGITRPIGNIDLYFNGGFMQPKCNINIACSHSRGVLYLAQLVADYECGFPGVSTSYPAVTSPLINNKYYPKPDTTDCFVMNHTIFDKNRGLDKLKRKIYYMFVNSDTFSTQESFSCQH